jgi:CubicO group peptidase (beta-lactamase class C family)
MDGKLPLVVLAAVILCSVIIAGCTSAPATQSPGQAAAPPVYPGTADPAGTAAKLDAFAAETFAKSGVPGMAVAVVKDDKVVYMRCFGVRNVTTKEPVDPDTRFQLASISKSFTTASIASLVGKGELSWDQPVSALYPGFRLKDSWVTEHTTIRDLLMHRTGLPEYGSDDLQEIGYNRSEMIQRIRFINLTGEFRSSYAYSNIGITTAAEAAARTAGMSWEDLVAERVFAPVGMRNTSVRFDDFLAASHADTYPMNNGKTGDAAVDSDAENSPAGGVTSTLNDMVRYARFQLNDGSIDGSQVIAADAIMETHKPQNIMKYLNGTIVAYGLGWEVISEDGVVRVEHGGDLTSGVSTYITLYPKEKMAIIVLTNGFPDGHVLKKAVSKSWEDLYYRGKFTKDWYTQFSSDLKAALQAPGSVLNPFRAMPDAPADAKPPRSLDAYTGTYTQDYYGDLRIEKGHGNLRVWAGHLTEPYTLVPYDGDMFREPVRNTSVRFAIGSEGRADSVTLGMFEYPGRSGRFVRAG